MVDLGHRLRDLRKNSNLTQQQVAERIGVTKAMISSYELDTRQPSYDILIKLAALFGVTTDYLLGITQNSTLDTSGISSEHIALLHQIANALRK